MSTTSFFGDMLQTIAERGRRFLAIDEKANAAGSVAGMEALCETLLSSRGEASGMALARDVLDRWRRLDEGGQRDFMSVLVSRFGPDTARLERAIESYGREPTTKALLALHEAAEPRRQ